MLKMHRQMADMMKKLGKGGMKNLMGGLGGGLGGGLPGELPKDIGQMPDLGKIGLGQSAAVCRRPSQRIGRAQKEIAVSRKELNNGS